MQDTGMFPIEKSSYYQAWLREQDAINTHKWFLSEKIGHDVGFAFAQWDWIWTQREKWLRAQGIVRPSGSS